MKSNQACCTYSFDKYDEPRIHMEVLMNEHLINLDLPIRILFSLEKAGIKKIGDLTRHTRKSLSQIRNIGKSSIDLIEGTLKRLNLNLAH